MQQERKGVQSGTWDQSLWKFLKLAQRSLCDAHCAHSSTHPLPLDVCLLFSCQVVSDSL